MVQRFKNILILIAVFGLTFMLTRHKYAEYNTKKGDVETGRVNLERWKLLVEVGGKVAHDCDELVQSLTFRDEDTFKKFVEDKVRECDMVVDSFRPTKIDKGSYLEIKIDIVSTSLYESVMNFVKALEEKKVEIVALEIRNTSEASRQVAITVKGVALKT